ncbi:MAG: ornithine carbamoyltransferase [Helicobacter sp.]|uniref:ornithine carbamoyltransferase n=1 Tax=Helicobacter sp. TaxID=218 RepID=UPI0023D05E8D|nr:ornithine carbamoyltransferase [Helicobacter sp.]MDE5925662.1 ornithine carbamoyltransferase [Helicobacter sp.]MDE7175559.1 ornithine carbamoyltransferase [Helicobacter sp.]
MRHFLTLADFSKEEILEILTLAKTLKNEVKSGIYSNPLAHKTLGMIFEKNSTRTRVSFETGIYQLGGNGIFLSSNDTQLGRGEPIKDTARVLSSMVDLVMMRTHEHSRLEEFAAYSNVPVINGLSDDFHPMQLLADFMTMQECGKDKNPIVAYIGDGNNMAHSWLMLAAKLGFTLRIASPKDYKVSQNILQKAESFAKISGAKILLSENPKEAILGADVVTTDTWASMGQEEQKEARKKAFQEYCVDSELMKLAKQDAIFLHCLPAYRGQEVSEEVLESEQSKIFQEAENRLHAQKGVMVWLHQNR